METPRYGIDSKTNMAYSTILANPEEWVTEKDPAAKLIGFNIFLTTRLFNAMTKIMYGGLSPVKAVALLDKKGDEKNSSGETVSSDPSNRIKGLMGGNPELN